MLGATGSVDGSHQPVPVHHVVAAAVSPSKRLKSIHIELGKSSEVTGHVLGGVVPIVTLLNLPQSVLLVLQRQHTEIPADEELANMLGWRLLDTRRLQRQKPTEVQHQNGLSEAEPRHPFEFRLDSHRLLERLSGRNRVHQRIYNRIRVCQTHSQGQIVIGL